MEKKIYLIPQTKVFEVELHLMNEISGGGSQAGDPQTGGVDNGDGTNRSRRRYQQWDYEDEEEDW
jgi:hypothetical protein